MMAMMYGRAISLPESALVQSPLRPSACAHTHMHTRTRASSDARPAATRGAGRLQQVDTVSARLRVILSNVCHAGSWFRLGFPSVGGSSDDIVLTSPTRGWLSNGACVHLLWCRVPSHRSSGLVVPQCQGSRFVARGGRARSGACMHGVWHMLDIHGLSPNCPWKQSFEKNPGLSAS